MTETEGGGSWVPEHCVREQKADTWLKNVSFRCGACISESQAKEKLWDSGNQKAERRGDVVGDLLDASGTTQYVEKPTPPTLGTPLS